MSRLDESSIDFDGGELREAAEGGRRALPDGFLPFLDYVESALSSGVKPQFFVSKGPGDDSTSQGTRLGWAVLEELKLLLCTEHPRYADVRTEGRVLAKTSVAAVAAYVAGAVGISMSIATAAVAFAVLLVARVGIAVFCRYFPGQGALQPDPRSS
jgi:hypothetical protein